MHASTALSEGLLPSAHHSQAFCWRTGSLPRLSPVRCEVVFARADAHTSDVLSQAWRETAVEHLWRQVKGFFPVLTRFASADSRIPEAASLVAESKAV